MASLPHENEDHEVRPFTPSALRKRLSQQFPDQESAGQGNKKKLITRRASTMTAAMGVGAIDPEVRKRWAPVVIIGLLYFKKPVSVTDLRAALKERLLDIPRFLCHPIESENKEVMMEQLPREEIDMDYHVHEMKQEKPWKQNELDEYLSKLYNDPAEMDNSKPPWRFITVPKMEDGRSLVVAVIDHTLVDGVAAVATLMAILDDNNAPGGAEAAKPKTKRLGGPALGPGRKLLGILRGIKTALLGPVLPADAPNKLKEKDHRNPGKDKSCGFGDAVSLNEMKEIKQKFPGATVNDIMLATLTLTVRRYFAEIGEASKSVRGNFPINLRPPKQDVLHESMGNRFQSGTFQFPLDVQDPVDIVWAVKQQIDMIKVSPAPILSEKLLGFLVPLLVKTGKRQQLVDTILDAYGKVTCMLSNVPGPSEQVYLCKQPVDDLKFFAFAPLGVYFGILSYMDRVSVGVVSGKGVESDAGRIAKHWAPAFRELADAVKKVPKPVKPSDWADFYLFGGLFVLAAAFAKKLGLF